MSATGSQGATAELLCDFRHEPLTNRLTAIEAQQLELVKAVSEMRGAWKLAVILGSIVGTGAGIAVEVLLRLHGG